MLMGAGPSHLCIVTLLTILFCDAKDQSLACACPGPEDPDVVCPLKEKRVTFILALSSSGSTYLQQLVNAHPCSSWCSPPRGQTISIAVPSTERRLRVCDYNRTAGDGVRERLAADEAFCNHSDAEWARFSDFAHVGESCQYSAAGVMINAGTARSLLLAPQGFEHASILVLRRDPFFIALSQVKKSVLESLKQRGEIHCGNVNLRGAGSCTDVHVTLKYTLPAKQLQQQFEATKQAQTDLYRSGAALATHFGTRFGEVQYTDLLKAQGLPVATAEFLGLGSSTDPSSAGRAARVNKKLMTAVRTSFDDVRSSIANIDQLVNDTLILGSSSHYADTTLPYLKFLNGKAPMELPESWYGTLVK